MPITPLDLLNEAAEDANGVLGALPGLAADGAAKYVKDGTPSGVIPNLGVGLARAACRRYGSNPGAVPGRVAAGFERVCRPYLDEIGEGTGPAIEKPFDGGQCPADYFVTFSQTDYNTDGTVAFNSSPQLGLRGPLGGVEHTNSGCGPVLGPLAPGAKGFCAFMQTGNGRILVGGNGNGGISMSVASVVRQDAGPDTCGNPPPVVTQPRPPIIPVPIIIPIVLAPEVNVDVEVDIDVDGRVTFDIGPDSVTINPFGGGDDGEGPGDGGEEAPGAPEPGPELPGGNGGFGGDDQFGAPPAGKRWVGACIRIVASPPGAGVIPQSVPDDVYPTVVGNLRLVGAPGGGRLVDTPIQIRAKHVCVWEPVRGFNPTGVSVDLLPGYGYTYRPYAVPEEN